MIDKLHQTYDIDLGNKDFAYDGEKSLFTLGALPQVKNEFTVVLEDVSSARYRVFFVLCALFLCYHELSVLFCV